MRNIGHLYALGAFGIWGFFPIYWKLLTHFTPFELTAYRIIWSFLTLTVILLYKSNLKNTIKEIFKTKVFIHHLLSTLFIGINWFLFIYAVNTGNILQGSFGYFIGPIFSVIIGISILKEKINKFKVFSILLMLFAVGIRLFDISNFPWISLLLGLSFALYGLMRKYITVSSIQSVTYETFILLIPALFYTGSLEYNNHGNLLSSSSIEIFLLSLTGILTITPLILFSGAAKRVELNTLGFFQYLAPSLQFLCAVIIFNETMDQKQWISFIIIWIACIILIYNARFSKAS